MQRQSVDLGYLRKNIPYRVNEGSRGRYAAPPPPTKSLPVQNTETVPEKNVELAAPVNAAPVNAAPVNAAPVNAAPVNSEQSLRMSDTVKELAGATNRIDQISMKVSVLDGAVKAIERSMIALREEQSSIAKTAGGQTSERVDALAKQIKVLEESFTEFSSRLERQNKDTNDEVSRLRSTAIGNTPSHMPVDQETVLKSMSEDLEKCKMECKNLMEKKTQAIDMTQAEIHREVSQTVIDWLQDTAIPDLKRNTLERSAQNDIVQNASDMTYERLRECLEAESKKMHSEVYEAIHRYSFPIAATVLRETNGFQATETVTLRHPVHEVDSTSYMQLVRRGANGSVSSELFPVIDAQGPYVAFADSTDAC